MQKSKTDKTLRFAAPCHCRHPPGAGHNAGFVLAALLYLMLTCLVGNTSYSMSTLVRNTLLCSKEQSKPIYATNRFPVLDKVWDGATVGCSSGDLSLVIHF
jgi:hypothetical protein